MTDTTTETPTEPAPVGSLGEAIACERCGEQAGRYVVSDILERDTSLFCSGCLVMTYAQVMNEILRAEAEGPAA